MIRGGFSLTRSRELTHCSVGLLRTCCVSMEVDLAGFMVVQVLQRSSFMVEA